MLISIRRRLANRRGFTLVELMVVIAILGILAALAVPKFANATDTARDTKLKADLRTLDGALNMYYAANNGYPQSLTALVPTYIASVPNDATGSPIAYTYYSNTTYDLSGKDHAGNTRYSPGSYSYTSW